jgi:hypothetical protein
MRVRAGAEGLPGKKPRTRIDGRSLERWRAAVKNSSLFVIGAVS